MKKVIVIYVLCVISLFCLPVLLVKQQDKIENSEQKTNKIKLLLSESNTIVEMDFDEYIMGVLVGEMPVNYELEALKAQAVVARTYSLNKILYSTNSHENADMCDDITHCQAYKTREYALSCWDDNVENEKWNKVKEAVLSTKNEVIVHNGILVNAFFHANSGGMTEDISNIWGRENIPYLKSVSGNEDDERMEKIEISYTDVNKIMIQKYMNFDRISEKNIPSNTNGDSEKVDFEIMERNSSGRVSKFRISNIILEGTEVRSLFNLLSTNFEIELLEKSIIFKTKGYGHGVGMSQVGANSMAKLGSNYEEIIKHYYSGVEIRTMAEK